MADLTSKTDKERNLSDIPIEDTDLVSDIPVEDTGEPIISDLPQAITESLGTGVALEPGLEIGGRTMQHRMEQYTSASPELTGGDIDARWDQAEAVGDEAVGERFLLPIRALLKNWELLLG
jgi:hypothetical protein